MHKQPTIRRGNPYLLLFLLTLAALFVQGYHPAAEDGEIYLPGIKKILNPSLYPFGSEFFANHAGLTMFPHLIAASVRASHLPFDLAVFLWYLLAIFLTLVAAWEWTGEFFDEPEARWAGVGLLAALLTLPVAGTALYISDQYLTPRSLSLFSLLFATRNALHARYGRFAAWSIFAALVHPLMAVFGISLGLLLLFNKERTTADAQSKLQPIAAMSILPLFPAASEAYRDALHTRSYFFILQWEWYELLGAIAPLALFWWFARMARDDRGAAIRRISRTLIVYGSLSLVTAAALTIPRPFETLARLQPMRSLVLLYTFLILVGGGFLGAKLLNRRLWRWALLFLPLCGGMFFAQRQLFADSPHIEWPGAAPTNDWLRAFEWIRINTPVDAVFAMDPRYMQKDDQHGFRAIAERSRLADAVKDSGAVSMFPEPGFAEHWVAQTADQKGWRHFQLADFHRLKAKYGVTWAILERPCIDGLSCPYGNSTLLVCKIE
jgi:hypothetical protein